MFPTYIHAAAMQHIIGNRIELIMHHIISFVVHTTLLLSPWPLYLQSALNIANENCKLQFSFTEF
jgi:hypothetical protein